MTENVQIEEGIEEEIRHLLEFMKNENDYSENYRSMFSHLTKVLELRQKEFDNSKLHLVKLQELQQQKTISEETNALKLQELQQQKAINEATNALKLKELQQQKSLADDANEIKHEELALKKTITKETWLNVGTHVAGLIILMNHERAHVIASKAFGLVKKIF